MRLGTCSTTRTRPPRRPGGLIHGGFWDAHRRPGARVTGNHSGVGPDVCYTGHHYDTTVTEPRIASYIGIADGQIPAKQYYGMWRTFPSTCDWRWQEMQPLGENRTYLGVDVYEGDYSTAASDRPRLGRQHVRGADVPCSCPRRVGARAGAVNHPLYVARAR